MLIVCPSCASEYAIDPARIGPAGRRVRCASCRESWSVASPSPAALEPARDGDASSQAPLDRVPNLPFAAAAEPEPELPVLPPVAADRSLTVIEAEAPASPPARPYRPSGRSKPRRSGRGLPIPTGPWAKRLLTAALLVVALAVPAALAGRTAVVRALPHSAVLFEAFGMPVNLVGLDFAGVTSALGTAGGKPELVVEGRIANPGAHPVAVPPVEIAIRGEDGALLYNWSVPAQDARVAGGDSTRFRARLASPPPAGRAVAVTFRAGPEGATVALR